MYVCAYQCGQQTVVRKTTQSSYNNLPSQHPDKHYISQMLSDGEKGVTQTCCDNHRN